jgi:hypothetical protein
MRYVYELMTHVERLPRREAPAADFVALNEGTAHMLSDAVDGFEKRMNQDLDVLSHAQYVVGDRVVTTLLVRRPASSADPRRN